MTIAFLEEFLQCSSCWSTLQTGAAWPTFAMLPQLGFLYGIWLLAMLYDYSPVWDICFNRL